MLEGELGGELIRREGRLSRLTDLGMRMIPLLRQCFDSALSAKAVARAVATGEVRVLSLGLSRTVDLRLLGPVLGELFRAFPGLRLQLKRGNAQQLLEYLKSGEVDFGIAGPLGSDWDRLNSWPIFSESFQVLLAPSHRLAARKGSSIRISDLLAETFLLQSDSETVHEESLQLSAAGICMDRSHMVDNDSDLATLVEANMGVALAPKSALRCTDFERHTISGLDLRRTVTLYTVQGRVRSTEAAAFISQIRAEEWNSEAN